MAPLKEKNIFAIIGMIIVIIAALIEIISIGSLAIFNYKFPFPLGECLALLGFLFCIVSIVRCNHYKKNYEIIVYIMIVISVLTIGGILIIRYLRPVEPYEHEHISSTISWDNAYND